VSRKAGFLRRVVFEGPWGERRVRMVAENHVRGDGSVSMSCHFQVW